MTINNGLKILQWNPNGFYSKLDEINLLLNKYCPISICLQETNFINDKVCSLKNYTTYYKNRTNAGRASGGVAIYVNSNYHSEEIIINTNLEVVAVNVLIKNSITICNLYLPNSQNFEQSDIQNIINQLPSPYILLGDFNSHSPLWGCSTLDSRGTKIEQTLYSNNDLNILNSGQATRVSASTGHFSAIDLSFSSATITPYIDWDVIPELSSSDHFPIIMTLNHTNSHNHYTRKRKWKLKNVDRNIYQTEIDKNIDSTPWTYTNNVEDKIKLFTDLIINTASDVFELTSYSGKRPPVPWWNKTIKQAIRKKKSAFNRYKRTLDLQDFIQFKKNKALVRYLIKSEKKKSWINFTSSLNSHISPTIMWNKIKTLKEVPFTQIKTLLVGQTVFTDPKEITNQIGQYFYSNSSNSSLNPDFLKFKETQELITLPSPTTTTSQALNYIARILSSPENSTLPFLTQNRFANTFCSNPNLKKPLGQRMLYEMSHTNIDPNLIIKQECSVVPPWRVPTFLVDTSLADHSKKETLNVIYKNLFNEIMDSFPSEPQIYTDASKTNSGVAIAIIKGEQSISYKLPDHNSIYTAEYFALLEGVHLAIQLPDSTINICTDSLSALNNLKYNLHSSILAIKISNIIENANKNIRFIWTPGHSGIDGNEKADKAAREAVNNPLTEIRTYSSLIDIHRNVNTYCTNLWESEWRRTPNNKLREIKNTTEYWPKPHTSNRKDEVVINRLRIGHSKMSHGHLMRREEPAMCLTCGEPLTVKHLLIHCRIHIDTRKSLKLPDNLFEALSPIHDNTNKIIIFLKQIDMYNLI
ncbi:hypothetical protein AGLY_018035 [Aphis glycines]|uniref:RNase H type-1 domain-containing protein n=1 Tax=Aphis glycines TaxID=307491 RepID=A0A6G0SV41_APHGL|nr:hypothetical protein AGLY_018035 [Aphis glycines]